MQEELDLFNFEQQSNFGKPALQVAAEKHIQKLKDSDLLTPEHYLAAQLTLDLAKVCGTAAAKGSASAVALASKELRETIAMLPEISATDDFVQSMRQAGFALS